MALIRLVVLTQNGGLKSHADEGGRDFDSEFMQMSGVPFMERFTWVVTGVNIWDTDVRVLPCDYDADGNVIPGTC